MSSMKSSLVSTVQHCVLERSVILLNFKVTVKFINGKRVLNFIPLCFYWCVAAGVGQ